MACFSFCVALLNPPSLLSILLRYDISVPFSVGCAWANGPGIHACGLRNQFQWNGKLLFECENKINQVV